MHQLLDLLAGHLAPAGQLAEHPLAIRARLVDHVAALLLGHLQLGLGIGRCVLTAASRFDLGFLAQTLRFVGGLAQQPRRVLLGADLDLRRGLAGGGEDARGLFAEQPRDHFFVERDSRIGVGALRAVRSSRSRNFSRSCRRASSAATMRRKSRTSPCSNPLRDVANVAVETADGDDGSGRENDMAIDRQA